jgi:hypothetical protein
MKKYLLLLAFFVTSLNSFAQAKDSLRKAIVQKAKEYSEGRETRLLGKKIGPFTAMIGDSAVTDSMLQGKVAYLYFLDNSQPMVLAQVDGINQLYKQLKDSANFVFIGITAEPADVIEKMRKQHLYQFTIAQMPKNKMDVLKQQVGVPTSIIIGRDGLIKNMHCSGSIYKDLAKYFVLTTLYTEAIKAINTK